MVNGLHLHSAFIQSAVQFMPLIHPFTHTFTFTHQQRLAAMQGTNQLDGSNWQLGVLLRDTSIRPRWDRTGNPPTARRQLLPPEPYLISIKYGVWARRQGIHQADACLVHACCRLSIGIQSAWCMRVVGLVVGIQSAWCMRVIGLASGYSLPGACVSLA